MKVYYTGPYKLTKKYSGDAAYDLRAQGEPTRLDPLAPPEKVLSGVRVLMPSGTYALVLPRSGHSLEGLRVCNSPGLIDSSYTGDVSIILQQCGEETFWVSEGERVAQLMFQPDPFFLDLEWVSTEEFDTMVKDRELADGSEVRGTNGFGSTGVK